MKTQKLFIGLFIAALTFTSCSDDEGVDFQPSAGNYENGIIIGNEGNFGDGNSSVSYVSNDFNTVRNGIFNYTNNIELGDTNESIAFNNGYAYIILNGSNKIEIVDRYSFESIKTIDTGLENPRYMAFANGKGYVTNWGDGFDATDDFIAVVELEDNTISSTISLSEGPEQIVSTNGKLYISHKGAYGTNNIITSIDTSNNNITTITVDDNPDEILIDSSNNIWVLSEGKTEYDSDWNVTGRTTASLKKINSTTNTEEKSIIFPEGIDPKIITYDSGNIYFYANSKIYMMNEADESLPENHLIQQTVYKGLTVRNGYIYCTNSDFTLGEGELFIYDESSLNLVETISLNVGSSKIYFNN